jgi:hypothetical protein
VRPAPRSNRRGGAGSAARADPAAGSTNRVGRGEASGWTRPQKRIDGDLAEGGEEGSPRLTRNEGSSPEEVKRTRAAQGSSGRRNGSNASAD